MGTLGELGKDAVLDISYGGPVVFDNGFGVRSRGRGEKKGIDGWSAALLTIGARPRKMI
jgi:hypothetical protein